MISDLLNDSDFPDLFNDGFLVPNITPADKELITMLPSELKAINDRIERLEIALNTQTLRLELERAKRQKLASIVKQRRHETHVTHLEALQQLTETNYVHQEAINYQLGGSIDHLSTVTFRCLSRTQQLLSYAFSCIPITPSDHPDVTCLLEEIGRTLQQLCIYQPMTTPIWL